MQAWRIPWPEGESSTLVEMSGHITNPKKSVNFFPPLCRRKLGKNGSKLRGAGGGRYGGGGGVGAARGGAVLFVIHGVGTGRVRGSV